MFIKREFKKNPPPLHPPSPWQPGCDGGHLLFQFLLGPVHLGSPLRRTLPPPGGPGACPARGRCRGHRSEEGQGQEEEERKEGEEREEEKRATQESQSEYLILYY